MEANANSYASQLILPDYLVEPWIGDRRVNLDLAQSLGQAFEASVTASALKLVKRSKTAAAVVCHDQRRLKWFQRSRAFPDDFYILKELHQDTVAFEMAFGTAKGISRPKKNPASLWLGGRGAYRMEVWSQSIKLPEGAVLTTLSMT